MFVGLGHFPEIYKVSEIRPWRNVTSRTTRRLLVNVSGLSNVLLYLYFEHFAACVVSSYNVQA